MELAAKTEVDCESQTRAHALLADVVHLRAGNDRSPALRRQLAQAVERAMTETRLRPKTDCTLHGQQIEGRTEWRQENTPKPNRGEGKSKCR
jgi:hypothetical protein